jgi:hypothetical protein
MDIVNPTSEMLMQSEKNLYLPKLTQPANFDFPGGVVSVISTRSVEKYTPRTCPVKILPIFNDELGRYDIILTSKAAYLGPATMVTMGTMYRCLASPPPRE